MSSVSGDQSSQFIPPQSGQPYRSLFGGSSSHDVADLGPLSQPQRDAAFDQHPHNAVTEDGPLVDNGFSDEDADYIGSDGDFSGDAGYFDSDDGGNSVTQDDIPSIHGKYQKKSTQEPNSPPSSPSYRPNRFRGLESTWRKLTAGDRQIADALENLRARDLAAHLFNAYALRVRAGEIARRAAGNEEQLDPLEAFAPPKWWTAWPLPANEVLRGSEHFRRREGENRTRKMPHDPPPSADLEESIIAVMLKSAKERYESRPWDSENHSLCSVASQEYTLKDIQEDTQDDSSGRDESMKIEPDSGDERPLRPVMQADDEISRLQLRPLTRNIITQLDRLLMGLHHARKGVVEDSSDSEWQTDTESIVSGMSSPQKRRASRLSERSQSRGRKRTCKSIRVPRSGDSMGLGSVPNSLPQSRASTCSRGRSVGSKSSMRSASRVLPGVRDWSEVLGVASMVGFPPTVVMRTAQRCATLFGEDMVFRTFTEEALQTEEEDEEESEEEYQEEDEEEEEGGVDAAVWEYAKSESREPESSLPLPPPERERSRSRATSRAASAKVGSNSRPTSRATLRAASRATSPTLNVNEEEVSQPKGKGPHRKKDIICPIKTCPRHEDGFSRRWNLNKHIKSMHPWYRKSTDAKSPGAMQTEDESDAE
ncbi:hypothetical protein EYZ11_000799 [Aspergillus tanneri]|uniref:Rrn9 domain-containing protein n=1 Tax=Aspergillus tanneri TaxID=1220188 RepID=A0A4S3JW98_9EURO|nr:uncharacterized protein ATNIH1004_004914 [Aspergillus tanneri]KAA8649023.1 hypothetical protein ATNIH1004_004914 [Aspergillus tanneri]THC99749.1 hypothetical protein EYZ11_000799 [Aspergillus tanneri]